MTPTNAVPDEAIIEAVEDAIQDGETDVCGGAPPPAVAARLPLQADTVSERLRNLADENEIEQVWGWSQIGAGARRSYRIGTDKD